MFSHNGAVLVEFTVLDRVHQVAAPVSGRAVHTGDKVCYPRLPFIHFFAIYFVIVMTYLRSYSTCPVQSPGR